MKKQNGVTLVALVLTVIIMMILTAVSITMLTDDDETAMKASNDLKGVTNEILEQHDSKISDIINEIKYTNVY